MLKHENMQATKQFFSIVGAWFRLNRYLFLPYSFHLLFANHIVCTVLYLLPNNPLTNHYSPYVNTYISTLFSQNWNLFAPEPSIDRVRLLVRCKKDTWSKWYDPGRRILDKHHRTRILGYGKILYVYRNIAKDLASKSHQMSQTIVCSQNKKTCIDKFFPSLKETAAWKEASRLAKFTCYSTLKENMGLNAYQISIVLERVRNYSKRTNEGVWGDVAQLKFPEDKI